MCNYFKEIWRKLAPFLPGILILFVLSEVLHLDGMYLKLPWLIVCLLIFVVFIGIDKFSLGTGPLQVTLEKAKAAQHGLDDSLTIVVPIIARIAFSDSHSNLFPGRLYIYQLIQKINDHSTYSEGDKEKLTEECKWVLLKWLFEHLKKELEKFSNGDKDLEKELNSINTDIKNILNQKEYQFIWLRNKVINLRGCGGDSEADKNEYNKIINDYQKLIEDFICDNTIPQDFLKTGKRTIQ
jgi:hypothetical protein